MSAAVLTSAVYVVLYYFGLSIWPATLLAVAVGFTFRILALVRGWEEPEPWEPSAAQAGEPERRPLRVAIAEKVDGKSTGAAQ